MRIHLTAKELNRFLENLCSGAEAERIAKHLQECKECFALYQDSARYRSMWEADPEVFKCSPELVALGEKVAGGKTLDRRVPRKRWMDIFRRRLLLWPAALAIVVLAAGAMWFGQDRVQHEFQLDSDVTAPVQAAIEEMSARGPIVLPGGEGALDEKTENRRSGSIAQNDSLLHSLDDLFRAYHGGKTGRDVLYWLVSGYLASEQVNLARDYGRKALEKYPEDDAIVTLAALVAYRLNDPARSKSYLHRVINRSPDDAVALINLGVVYKEDGDEERALEILQEIRDEYTGQPIGNRAESLIKEIQGDI